MYVLININMSHFEPLSGIINIISAENLFRFVNQIIIKSTLVWQKAITAWKYTDKVTN